MALKFLEIKPGMVIHCPMRIQAEALHKRLKELGRKNDIALTELWDVYGSETAYRISVGSAGELRCTYEELSYYRDNGDKIIEFDELLIENNQTTTAPTQKSVDEIMSFFGL